MADLPADPTALAFDLSERHLEELEGMNDQLERLADSFDILNAHLEHLVEAVYDVSEAIRQSKLELEEDRDINIVHDVNAVIRDLSSS